MIKLAIVVISFLLGTAVGAEPRTKIVTLYGLESVNKISQSGPSNTKYLLQIGAFKKKENALYYEKFLINHITATIRIIFPQSKKGLYQVLVGPLDYNSIVETSQLLSKKQPQPISPKVPVNNQTAQRTKIKEEAQALKSELTTILLELERETDKEKTAELENRKTSIQFRMNEIVLQVIKRLTAA